MSEVEWDYGTVDLPDEDDEVGELEIEDCSWGSWRTKHDTRRISSICSQWR